MHPAARVLHELIDQGTTPGLQYLHFSPDAILFRCRAGMAHVARQAPVEQRTTFSGFSVTKTVTAVAILQLVEAGLVSLDEPARDFLPEFPYPGGITVRHLLNHSAGIPNPLPLRWTHAPAEHDRFDRDAFFAREHARHPRTRSEPGARFHYSNLGYQLLGQLIERVTRRSYEDHVTEHVLSRLGTTPAELGFTIEPSRHATGYHNRRSLTYPVLGLMLDRAQAFAGREGRWQAFRPLLMNGPAYGGLIGNADGFARYLQALMERPSPLLADASIAQLFRAQELDSGSPSQMCLSWFVGAMQGVPYRDHAGGGGGFYAELRVYPTLRRASVLLCNRTGLRNDRLLDRVDQHFMLDQSKAQREAV